MRRDTRRAIGIRRAAGGAHERAAACHLRGRAGTSLVELLLALALTGVVAAGVGSLLRTESRLAAHSADRAEALDALRTAAAILAADLAPLDSADLLATGVDSLALRVFRGAGIVCGFTGADPLVRYRGLRQPEPAKDSVLVITAHPFERADSLRAAQPAPGACAAVAGEDVFRIRVAKPVLERDVLLFFETGAYHLDGAFRYRRGAGGRQPLTADVFGAASRFTFAAGATGGENALIAELLPALSRGAARGLPLAAPAHVRVPLRNREQP